MTLDSLIGYAYDVQPFEFKGPDWTKTDRFDIEARFPEEANKDDNRKMLQTLLKDRFKLTYHIEEKELESDVLVVGKHGAKLKPSLPDPVNPEIAAPPRTEESNVKTEPAKSAVTSNKDGSTTMNMGEQGTQTLKFNQENWSQHWEVSKMTMEVFAQRLITCLGTGIHLVTDLTEIKGEYQLAWDCPMPIRRPPTSKDSASVLPSDPQDDSVLARSLDAMGLRLEKRKMLQDVYVIDHVDKPSEN
jgi:uncharacterized protein (TIGR03435 family)